MDGLLLDNDFRTRFSSFVFHLFIGVVVFGFAILLLPNFFLIIFDIIIVVIIIIIIITVIIIIIH